MLLTSIINFVENTQYSLCRHFTLFWNILRGLSPLPPNHRLRQRTRSKTPDSVREQKNDSFFMLIFFSELKHTNNFRYDRFLTRPELYILLYTVLLIPYMLHTHIYKYVCVLYVSTIYIYCMCIVRFFFDTYSMSR